MVETTDKKRFKTGSNFSDDERWNSPAIGSVITYEYFGLTKKDELRFASFMWVQENFALNAPYKKAPTCGAFLLTDRSTYL